MIKTTLKILIVVVIIMIFIAIIKKVSGKYNIPIISKISKEV